MYLFAISLAFDFAHEICHSNVWKDTLPRISEFSYFIFLWKIQIENGSDLCLGEKKNCSYYRVHGIQIDRLGLTVSTQKLVLKTMHWVPSYRSKCIKFCRFGLKGWFLHFFGNILGLGAYFLKLIFALKPWVQAGRFEYHEPYNPNIFFSPLKGSEPFWT